MHRICLLLSFILIISHLDAKPGKKKGAKKYPKELDELVIKPTNPFTDYKGSYTKFFDLKSTKLHVTPIFKEKILKGIAELQLTPHFYSQNKLVVDAKFMNINKVALITPTGQQPLSFTYDSLQINIKLDKTYHTNELINIYIDYTATPYLQDSIQIEDGRGLYFINTEGKNPYKPMHLWTQGEEESSSCWFPTIEATNQKTTQELFVTIDTGFISLSNGLLIDTKINNNGTKTDHWKQDKPHSPYLFFLGVGNYYKYEDKWRDKEVSAYTFPKYKDAIAEIFKPLPEMMEFFSTKLGVDYPWDKLGNMIAYDYTSGAMENTSAILYYDRLFCNHQQLIDDNFDWIISHELFHQWFGDLVTAESWANLTLNESLADYSEYLWKEYKNGIDEADGYRNRSNEKYFRVSKYKDEPIINYNYIHPHDLFDEIRYEKGGAVLNMLRNYVGDDAFFAALNKYLTANKFSNAELSDLRKDFEEITGEDLNWFFNQWWFGTGHPILNITHKYDATNKTIELSIQQTQTTKEAGTFRIPTKVDIYIDGKKETKVINIIDRVSTFYFAAAKAPQLVNFDADKVLLCEKTEDLSTAENIFKFYNAPKFKDKLEALEALSTKQKDNTTVQELFYKAMKDSNWYLRLEALSLLDVQKTTNNAKNIAVLKDIIFSDKQSTMREAAINKYVRIEKEKSLPLLEKVIQQDSSFKAITAALNNIYFYNKPLAYKYANELAHYEVTELMMAICKIYKDTTANHLDYFKKAIWLNNYRTSYSNFTSLETYLQTTDNITLENGISFLKDVYLYEEAAFNKESAKNIIKRLRNYFTEKAKKDKLADIKLQIINKTSRGI